MSSVVVSIPGDSVQWGPVQDLPDEQGACFQPGVVMQGKKPVLLLYVCWLEDPALVPVVSNVDGRHAGPRD